MRGKCFSSLQPLRRVSVHAILPALFFVSDALPAADGSWLGTADSNWATPANWSASPVPGVGDTASFVGPGNGQVTISLGAGVTIYTVNFSNAAAAAYTIGAGAVGSETLTLQVNGSIAQIYLLASTGNSQTVNAALRLGTNANAGSYFVGSDATNKKLTIAGPITGGTGGTAGTKTLQVFGSSDTDILGIYGGGGGTLALQKSGAGTLLLSGANTFAGVLTVSAGTVSVPVFNSASAAGPLGQSTQAATLSGGRLRYTGPTASSSKRLIASSSSSSELELSDGAAELTISGIVDVDGFLTKSGPGTLVLSGPNTYGNPSGFTVSAGSVRNGGSAAFGGSGMDLSVSGRLDLNGKAGNARNLSGAATGRIVNNGGGAALLTTTGTLTNPRFDGIIADNDNATAGTIALTKAGAGYLTLRGANTYSGATSVTDGVLILEGSAAALGNTTGGTTVSSGATLLLSNCPSVAEPLTISGAGDVSYGGALDNFGTSTYTGVLKLGAAATIGTTTNGGLLIISSPSPITATGAGFLLTLGGSLSANGVIDSVIGTGTGGVTKSGNCTWTLNGLNTFTGALTIQHGTLAASFFNDAGTDGPLGRSASAVSLNQSVATDVPILAYTGGTASTTKPIAVADSGTLRVMNGATQLTLAGLVSGAGVLTKDGPGTVIFTAANTYAGTILAAGTIRVQGSGRPGAATGTLTMGADTVLDLHGTTQTVGGLTGSQGATITSDGGGAATLTVNSSLASVFDGSIVNNLDGLGGTVSLTKSGSGSLTLGAPTGTAGLSTYTGPTLITDGSLTVTNFGQLGSVTSGTTVSSGATLTLANPGSTVVLEPLTIAGTGDTGRSGALEGGGATFGGPLTLSAAATVAATSGTFTITAASTISGNFLLTLSGSATGVLDGTVNTSALTKAGTGTWTLGGANGYAGVTTVSAGILRVTHAGALGTAAGNTTVSSGATLQLQGNLAIGGEALTIRGAGAAGATGALEAVSGNHTYGGLLTLGTDATIAVDAGSLELTHVGTITGAGFDLTLTGAGTGSIASIIGTGTGLVTKTGSGTWTLSGTNTFTGALTVAAGTLLVPVVNNASATGPLGNRAAGVVLGATGGSLGTLAYSGATASSNKPFTLATGGAGGFRVDDGAAALTLGGVISGSGNLVKSGPGELLLNGANTYTGSTSVTAGTLTVPNALLPNAADVALTSGATLNLTFTGADTVGRLLIDGVVQSPGSWGSLSSSATYRTPLITGPGLLNVAAGATQPPYASWAASFFLTAAEKAFHADPDRDGLANGLEWILGGNPLVSSAALQPQVSLNATQVVLTFNRNDASELSAALFAQWSTDLATWTDVPVGAGSATTPEGIVVSIGENGTSPDSVSVAFPRSLNSSGHLFLRLRATMP